jgi:hypothetical protein
LERRFMFPVRDPETVGFFTDYMIKNPSAH